MPLKLENAAKRVGNRWVYRDVTLEANDGEIVALFGPTGTEISEILRSFDVQVANDRSLPFLKRVTGGGVSVAERVASLESRINDLNGPLLLEDPLSGLDRVRKASLAEKIRTVAFEKNVPVVFCTSNFRDALMLADRVAAFVDGYIRQTGTPQELYDEPVTRAVAVLTGRHNLIEARRLTSSKAEMPEFQTIAGGHRLFTRKAEIKGLGPINQNAWLAVRPEQVSLSFDASFPEDNLLRAMITDVEFRGPVTYVRLDCGGLMLEAMVNRLVGLSVGDECIAALPPDRIRILVD